MPANQTSTLKLSQWEPDDEVLRTDFNADNAKIDAAAAELTRRVDELAVVRKLVVSAVPEVGSTMLHLPLSGVDRTSWRRLVLYGQIHTSGNYAAVYLNNNRRAKSVVVMNSTATGSSDVLAKIYGVGAAGGLTIFRMEFDLCAPLLICRYYSLISATNAASPAGNWGLSLDRDYSWSSMREITIADVTFLEGSKFEVWLER